MNGVKTSVTIGLGSNLGDRESTIRRALEMLGAHPAVEVSRCSTLIETEPWGVADQPPFINAVAALVTTLEPLPLLDLLKSTEIELGRTPRDLRWGPREIDLDILLYGDLVMESEVLTVPHPRMTERPFVLRQMVELDENSVHPKLGVPLRELL